MVRRPMAFITSDQTKRVVLALKATTGMRRRRTSLSTACWLGRLSLRRRSSLVSSGSQGVWWGFCDGWAAVAWCVGPEVSPGLVVLLIWLSGCAAIRRWVCD